MEYTENMLKEIKDLFEEGIVYENIIKQNKNNHKINITDVAISKIPYAKYPGIITEDCNKLYEFERLLLEKSKNENKGNKN